MTEQQQKHENMVAQREIAEESFNMNDDDDGDGIQFAEASLNEIFTQCVKRSGFVLQIQTKVLLEISTRTE